MVKINVLFSVLLLSVSFFLFTACEEENDLGPMDFKFIGVRDTVAYQGRFLERPVEVIYLGGERQKVKMSAVNVPFGVTISFSPEEAEEGQAITQRIEAISSTLLGTYDITITGTTESGNSISRTFKLRIDEAPNKPPRIFLKGNNPYNMFLNEVYAEAGATAGDEEDGDISSQIVIGNNINPDSVGTYKVWYVVSDSKGLKDSINRTVNVRNNLFYLNGQYSVITTDLQSGSTRNWITSMAASLVNNYEIKIFQVSDCFLADPLLQFDTVKDSLILQPQTFTCTSSAGTFSHTFQGAGVVINGTIPKVRLFYTDSFIDPGSGTPVTLQLKDEYQLF